jgi:hypothetical protein
MTSQSNERAPKLIRIGYWRGPSADGWPDPAQFVDPDWSEEEREIVAAYVKWGLVATAWCGPSRCRLCGVLNGSVELTDGTYIWPEGLFHYVAAHRVRLPREFVLHVRENWSRYAEAEIEEAWWRMQSGSSTVGGRRTSG